MIRKAPIYSILKLTKSPTLYFFTVLLKSTTSISELAPIKEISSSVGRINSVLEISKSPISKIPLL